MFAMYGVLNPESNASCILKKSGIFFIGFLLILILTSCKKVPMEIPKEEVSVSKITLSSYIFNENNQNGCIGRLFSPYVKSTFSLDKTDTNYAYVLRDSLYLTPAGVDKIIEFKRLDIDLKCNFLNQIETKQVTILADMFIRNKVIAHRGAWKKNGLPENSIASLKQAIALGCEASELDVHMTTDKVLVVNHDLTYGGMYIDTCTYAELFSHKLSNGENLPTLREYLTEAIKQQKTRLFLEIKSPYNGIADSVVSLVHQLKAQAWVTYIDFNPANLKRILFSDNGAKTLLLQYKFSYTHVKKEPFGGISFNYSEVDENQNLILEAQQNNFHIGAWTIDSPLIMKRLLTGNINSITTNEPEMLLELVK